MKSSLAIIIPTKNREKLLKRAIESVLKQVVSPEKLVVINDGSIDETKFFLNDFLKSHSNIIVINNEKSLGVNLSRRKAIDKVDADWVAWLDDDDEFLLDAVEKIKNRIDQMPDNFNVAYFNSLIKKENEEFIGGFQFQNINKKSDFYDPTYEETLTKFNLKGDCKPVFRRSILQDEKYFFPGSVNGFESYSMNLIAKDKKGIRYFSEITTIIHQESVLTDRLSMNASHKNPWPLLVLHLKQIPQHWSFYKKNPKIIFNKIITIIKLTLRVVFKFKN